MTHYDYGSLAERVEQLEDISEALEQRLQDARDRVKTLEGEVSEVWLAANRMNVEVHALVSYLERNTNYRIDGKKLRVYIDDKLESHDTFQELKKKYEQL